MSFDLVIRGGTVIDGAGLPGYKADVGIVAGRIAAIGNLSGERTTETLDAEGHVVSPGFIDAHTHMDAQIFWDPLGTCSCWHGVTSVVMGNCGFTLAPCAEADKQLVMRNLQRAEDISPAAMEAGITWSWETFREYLDAVDRLPKGINYAAYVGHSALRTYAMGERAFDQQATDEDLDKMKRELRDAVQAGAAGFSTSRSRVHETPDGRPVASRIASWTEVREMVGVMADLGMGVFELTQENVSREPEHIADFAKRLKALAIESRVPSTLGVTFGQRSEPDSWRPIYELADEVNAGGGRMRLQCTSRWGSLLRSFETEMPFGLDQAPVWRDVRKLPLDQQEKFLRNPETRRQMIDAAKQYPGLMRSGRLRPVEFDWLFVLDKPVPPYRSIADIAREQNRHPVETLIDIALEKNLKQFFIEPNFNEREETLLAMMRHPASVVTFSDSGAHVTYIMDSSTQTHMLSYWVRQRQAFTLEAAIRKMTFDIASFWRLEGRGLLRPGYMADVVVFDPATVLPQMPQLVHDLPTGAPRLKQKADGIRATLVAGQIVMRDNEHTGALPGRLLRSRAETKAIH